MKLLRSAIEELVGLFVDDWLFATLTVVWIGALAALTQMHLVTPSLTAALLFGGIAALLLIFVARKSRLSR